MAETLTRKWLTLTSVYLIEIFGQNIVYDFSGVRIGKAIPQDGFLVSERQKTDRSVGGRRSACLSGRPCPENPLLSAGRTVLYHSD